MEYGNTSSSEAKILNKTCGNLKDFLLEHENLSRNAVTKFELKRQTLDDFLRKLLTTSSVERTAGSRRPRSSQSTNTIAATEDTVNVNL